MQREGSFLIARVDGKIHEFIVNATDDEWRKRRRILTPAFSAHKMKLVRVTDAGHDVKTTSTCLWCLLDASEWPSPLPRWSH